MMEVVSNRQAEANSIGLAGRFKLIGWIQRVPCAKWMATKWITMKHRRATLWLHLAELPFIRVEHRAAIVFSLKENYHAISSYRIYGFLVQVEKISLRLRAANMCGDVACLISFTFVRLGKNRFKVKMVFLQYFIFFTRSWCLLNLIHF